MAGRDTNIGAKRARQAREELGIAAAAPLGCVLTVVEERLGLPVVVAELPERVSGCCWRDGERIVLWVNGTHHVVRKRFTLAHELGHVRCGHDRGLPVDTYETLAGRTTDSREIQANAFAAEFLAPAAGVRSLIGSEPELDEIVLLAARYGLSTIAALYRLSTLELISRRRYDQLKQAIENGEHGASWERLDPAVVEDELAGIDATALPRLSPALAGSALAGVIAGQVSIADAAAAAGCDAADLAAGATTINA